MRLFSKNKDILRIAADAAPVYGEDVAEVFREIAKSPAETKKLRSAMEFARQVDACRTDRR